MPHFENQEKDSLLQESNGLTRWQLYYLAEALTRAKRLEKLRSAFDRELCNSILYPTVHYDKLFRGNDGNPSPDVQAIKIIEAEERYARLVQQEYDRDTRWQSLLDWATDTDRIIMIRYFKKKKRVDSLIISKLLNRIDSKVEEQERRIEKERDQRAKNQYTAYRKKHPELFTVSRSQDFTDKKQVLVAGKFIYLTAEEIEAIELEKLRERIRLSEMMADSEEVCSFT